MKADTIRKVSVLNAEITGCGWTMLFAMNGLDVTLYDKEESALKRAKAYIRDSSAVLEENGALPPGGGDVLLGHIAYTTDLAQCLAAADYIQECMPETREGKRQILETIEKLTPKDAVVGSSCACYKISEIVPQTGHKERFLVVYALNPAHLVPLVEICGGPDTDPKIAEQLFAFFKKLKKEPVILKKELTGRVSTRIQAALMREMQQIVGEGVSTPADVNLSVNLSSGFRYSIMGPTLIYDGGNGKGIAGLIESTANDTGKKTLDFVAEWSESPWPEDILVPKKPEAFMAQLRKEQIPPEGAADRKAQAAWRDKIYIHQLQDRELLPEYPVKENRELKNVDCLKDRSIAGIRKIAVLGSGTIGIGWALCYAMYGLEVIVYDIKPESLEWARGYLKTTVQTMVSAGILSEAGKQAILSRVRYSTDIAETLKDPDFIQECVPEKVHIKNSLVEQIERLAPASALVGFSNSSMRISDLGLKAEHPERYIVIHPFNPPHLMPFMEISKGPKTAQETEDRVRAFLEGMNKKVVALGKESFGHIGNRLKAVLEREMTEAIGLEAITLEEGNRIIACGPGFRYSTMGPLLLADLETFDGILDYFEKEKPLSSEIMQNTAKWNVTPYPAVERTPEEREIFLKGLRESLLPAAATETREAMCIWRDKILIHQLLDHKLL